jgi:IS1 family transposase
MYCIVRLMNQLSTEKRAAVVAALVEGNSLRATARMTGVARMTVDKLLRDLGAACATYHDANVHGLKSQRIQCDEIWAFVGSKQKNVPAEKLGEWGDVWTYTAIDADSKLIVSWLVGTHERVDAKAFMMDTASRLSNRVQLTTDGFRHYLTAVETAFGGDVDFATLTKEYAGGGNRRYSPPRLVGVQAASRTGDPDPKHISTSYVERQNLTMRMQMRRFTRLTNGFSKKIEMHAHAVALHFMHYNFCRIHGSLRITPAMAAGVSDRVWEIQDLVALLAGNESSHVQAAS